MAKTLVGASGGGKVTVTGLTADAVKKGTTVTVKQGTKTIASVVGTLMPSPEQGTFTAYAGDVINTGMVGALQGSWGLNTHYHAIWSGGYGGTYTGWFANRVDMSLYRSIAVRKWGGGWSGNKGSYKFGVARTANQGEFIKFINVPAPGESNNNVTYTLDVSDVNEPCYIKFEGVNGDAGHGFNEITISI